MSIQVLRDLFSHVGMEPEFEKALNEECRNAYLHGLIDSAYSEWGGAYEHVFMLCEERNCHPCDISVSDLSKRFPTIIFQESEHGFQFARGRLFSLRDYQIAKECLAELGKDRFAQNFEQRFNKPVPVGVHLWEE